MSVLQCMDILLGKCDGGAAGVSLFKSEFTVIIHGILHRRHGKIMEFYFPNPVATLTSAP